MTSKDGVRDVQPGCGTERVPYRQSICPVQVWSMFDTGIRETH